MTPSSDDKNNGATPAGTSSPDHQPKPQARDEARSVSLSPTKAIENDSTEKGSYGVKRVVSCSDAEPSNKKSRQEEPNDTTTTTATNSSSTSECLDLALSLGFEAGDRIEVEWDVEDDEAVSTRWWGSTLLPFDGRTEENVAIRTLRYDPYPEGGFHESSDEDVIFVSRNILADPKTRESLSYRRAGAEEELVVQADESSVEGAVNTILQAALAKQQSAWTTMTPAQQADIASKIAEKKQKLVKLLLEQTSGTVTGQDMTSLLAQTMAE